MIDKKNFVDQPVKRDMRTYDNIQKIETGQGDDYTTDCIFDCKKRTGDSRYIYQNELNKACFQQGMMAYRDFEDLTRRTVSDKILRDKHLI